MIWRAPYEPGVIHEIPSPEDLPDGFYVGIFSTQGLREAEIWRRLAVEGGHAVTFLAVGFPVETLAPLVAPSATASWRDATIGWQGLTQDGAKSFGATISRGTVKTLVSGLPTEDVWEAVSRELSSGFE